MQTTNPLRAVSLGVALALAVPGLAVAGNDELKHDDKNKATSTQTRDMQQHATTSSAQPTAPAMRGRQLQDRPGQSAADARREAVIWTSFTLNSNLKATDVDVQVNNGTATLTGTVESQIERELAEDIAESVSGIEQVTNRIQIDPEVQPYVAAKTERTGTTYATTRDTDAERDFGTALSDATTTAQVKSKLLWNTNTDGLDINVDTMYGRVTLEGTADSENSKRLAERLARDTNGVVAVDNRLVISPDSTAVVARETRAARDDADIDADVDVDMDADTDVDAMATRDRDSATTVVDADFDDDARMDAQARVDVDADADADADVDIDMERPDGWITTKVKSTLLFSRSVDGFDIDVDTREGVVHLDGTVASSSEKQQAVQLAREVVGVRSVDASGLQIVSDEAVVRTDED